MSDTVSAVILWFSLIFITYETYHLIFLPPIHDIKFKHNTTKITNKELQNVTKTLFSMDTWSLGKYISVNYQGQLLSKNYTDIAQQPLLHVSPDVFADPVVESLIKLFDNYEPNTLVVEDKTFEENTEENKFINCIMSSNITLYIMNFLSTKGFFEADVDVYKKILKFMWFQHYARNVNGIINSSGFEHIFLGETKLGKTVTGLHNWIYFSQKEISMDVNYLGYRNKHELTEKTSIIELYFTYKRQRKFSSMFIGTSPELEISLYTLCFFARPNKRCHISLDHTPLSIQTHKLRNTDFIASAYPIV